MRRLTVLVGEDVGEANLDRMRVGHPGIEFLLCPEPEAFLASAPQADIIFTNSGRARPSAWRGDCVGCRRGRLASSEC